MSRPYPLAVTMAVSSRRVASDAASCSGTGSQTATESISCGIRWDYSESYSPALSEVPPFDRLRAGFLAKKARSGASQHPSQFTRDPSLRLKNGFGQDDARFDGFRRISDLRTTSRASWGGQCSP